MIGARILGTASVLPGRSVTTRELVERDLPGMDPAEMEAKTGIRARHWAEPGTTLAELGAEALRGALLAASMPAEALRRVLFVCSSGGDRLMPTTASAITGALGLRGSCDAIEIDSSCLGFLSALDLGARSVATGLGPVAVVVAETGSRYIRPEDPRPYVVFGDAASAAILGPAREGEGIVAASFGTDTTLGDSARLEHPGVTGERTYVEFLAPHHALTKLALSTLVRTAKAAVEPAGLSLRDVEWVLPHQPNGRMLDLIVRGLGVDPARIVSVVEEVGSVGAASIPVSLDRLLRTRPVRTGDHLLMAGIGAGVSYGAVLYRFAA